ncbi:late blight resistance homolog R1A-10 [Olea europaea subsp. europaea]|uniref:Late blight resistance homolog R1A-10 n=1 Tax=Olea europaea subsp. europaea TaxID=158383 RepID=A0A8S0TXP4_OLEEU|nr:late blight resistance homolog R1A-10 [Olea europaea subsp. europaea]
MADAAVEFLLENLKQLLVYNIKLIGAVKSEVEELYSDLKVFKAFLKDSTGKRQNHEVLKELVNQIRDVVYEAEDTVEAFVCQAAEHKARNYIEKAFHILDYPAELRKSVKTIENIRQRVRKIYENKLFGFEALQNREGSTRGAKEKKAPIVEEHDVVGFQDEANNLIILLNEGSEELEVTSIIGMPGLGKTTLARMIFRDSRIEYEFYNRAWVFVSQEYSRREVILNILSQFGKPTNEMSTKDDESLADELRKLLERGKYLIVLDDVWSEEVCNDLKVAFHANRSRSRILLTSRIENVALSANLNRGAYKLRFLTPDESWTLLQRKAVGSKKCDEELTKHGMIIAKECEGLPLAIVVIGGILLQKGRDSNSWERVSKSVHTYLTTDKEQRMNKFIELSFNHLPYHLKSCFLYFGMFPEDSQIPVWKLVRIWIAEGFIQYNEGMSLEDTAEEYLDDLVNMNLVMVGDWTSNGKVKTCHIHDMLHVFCKNQAKQESLFQEIKDLDQVSSSSSSIPSLEKCRRLCIHSNVLNYISSKPCGPRVRSFLCFSSEETILPREQISSIPDAFKLLRVLDSKPIRFQIFPKDLCQLVHLRYLVLTINSHVIPPNFSKLWNIQTLVIETESRNLNIQADIWEMIHLRHLKTNASTTLPPPRKKTQRNKEDLRTLSTISPKSCTEDVFARVPNLKKLGIRGRLAEVLDDKGGSSLFDSVGKLDCLENLKLWNDVYPQTPSEGKLLSFPQIYKFPPNLKKLTLEGTLLNWKHMSTLGMLESLEILKLKENAFKGDWWEPKDGGFGVLKVLHIGRTDLVTWKASSHHFPRLRSLYLEHCRKLQEVPSSFADVSSLQLMHLHCTTESAATSAKEIQLAKRTAQHSEMKLTIYPPDHDKSSGNNFLSSRSY